MKKFLAVMAAVLVALIVAVPVPNFDGHGEDTLLSVSTVYASSEMQRVHEHAHRALEECGKKKLRWGHCLFCYGSGRCQTCNGAGRFTFYDSYGNPIYQNCFTCNASGLCQTCGGRGGYYSRY